MGRPGVTEAEVFEAISTLREMGAKVTVESVRAKLGHGSPNTINRHLRTWREKPGINFDELKQQKNKLNEQLFASLEHNERLSHALFDCEQKILSLEKELAERQEAFKAVVKHFL